VLAEGKGLTTGQPPDGVAVASGQVSSTMIEPKARSWQAQIYSADEGRDVGGLLSGTGDHEQRTVIGEGESARSTR
jgi:hypothetical protein